MSLSVELPIDIIYNIIDYLGRRDPQTGAYDRETLRSCSLICRACVEISQKYLFYTITIQLRHKHHLHLLQRLLQNNESIGTYVRHLVLLDVGPDPTRIYQDLNDDTFELTLVRLPTVQRLEILSWGVDLGRFEWDALRGSTQVALENILAAEHFNSLRLSFTKRWPMSIFAISPGLRWLDLDYSELYDDVSHNETLSSANILMLGSLRASRSSGAVDMLRRLALQSQKPLVDFSILDELQFTLYGEEDIRVFGEIISLVGQNLRRLKLAINFPSIPSLFLTSMNASGFENLEYLEFSLGDEDDPIKNILIDTIQGMTRSFNLREVKIVLSNIYCSPGGEQQITRWPLWKRFDEVLSQEVFCNLQRVTLDIALTRKRIVSGHRNSSGSSNSLSTSVTSGETVNGWMRKVIMVQLQKIPKQVQLVVDVEFHGT